MEYAIKWVDDPYYWFYARVVAHVLLLGSQNCLALSFITKVKWTISLGRREAFGSAAAMMVGMSADCLAICNGDCLDFDASYPGCFKDKWCDRKSFFRIRLKNRHCPEGKW